MYLTTKEAGITSSLDLTVGDLSLDGLDLWLVLDKRTRQLEQYIDTLSEEITPIEWVILRSLFRDDGQHASNLARSVGRAATSFTPILDRLADKGLIKRRPDPLDRRAVFIDLTTKARKMQAVILMQVTHKAIDTDDVEEIVEELELLDPILKT